MFKTCRKAVREDLRENKKNVLKHFSTIMHGMKIGNDKIKPKKCPVAYTVCPAKCIPN